MKRPVHYVAAGNKGLAFGCYLQEYADHLQSFVPTGEPPVHPGWRPQHRATIPMPRGSTSLNKVSCPECWGEIAAMAQDEVG